MRVSDFHFDLPEELIAQHPPPKRGSSRMLVLKRDREGSRPSQIPDLTDDLFANLPNYLQPGDLLVLNDSRVLPARLFATRAGLSTQRNSPRPTGQIEVLLTEQIDSEGKENIWRALIKPARKVQPGETLHFHASDREPVLTAEVIATGEYGERTLRFSPIGDSQADFYAAIERIGHMPLPPYIRRHQAVNSDTLDEKQDEEEDKARYQTVYSNQPGSAAAPTAGLHFTPEILDALKARGVEIAHLTLHVGLGTFQPIRVSQLADIRLHAERYTVSTDTADALNRALREGRRIIAVGTTTTRTLEHIAAQQLTTDNYQPATIHPHSGSTSIFLSPGHRFRIVSGLLTNFHLPESTLLMLAAAFAGDSACTAGEAAAGARAEHGRQTILAAYAHAIRERYRFYSYGDCMLLL